MQISHYGSCACWDCDSPLLCMCMFQDLLCSIITATKLLKPRLKTKTRIGQARKLKVKDLTNLTFDVKWRGVRQGIAAA